MKKYNVKIKTVCENSITINANNQNEAIDKAKFLFENSQLKNMNIENVTKNYYIVYLNDKKIFRR